MSGQLLEAQKRLQANLDGALETCNAVLSECGSSADLPPIGTDSVCFINMPKGMISMLVTFRHLLLGDRMH